VSVEVNHLTKRLVLRLNTGLDENFNPVYRARSWSNVKPEVTNENLFALGAMIGDLTEHTLYRLETVDYNELNEI